MAEFKLMNIDEIKIKERYRKDLGNIKDLADSINEQGLLHPPIVTSTGKLIAGMRRIEACKRLGLKEIHVNVVDLAEPSKLLKAQRDENIVRKRFLPTEAVSIAGAIQELEEQAAEQRAEDGRRLGGLVRQGKVNSVETCHRPERAKTRDKVAACVGMSGRTFEKAREIVEAAGKNPEKYLALSEEMDRTKRIDRVHKKLKKMKQAEMTANKPLVLPRGRFHTIVCDPPWHCDGRPEDHNYPSMTLGQIKALPVAEIAHEDAILWLWSTNTHLPRALEVIKAWGFAYKTMLTWVKQQMRADDWLKGQTEHCLLAVRGKPDLNPLADQATVLHAPVQEESEKPEQFYQLAESLAPGLKVELFAKKRREGWEVYENNVIQKVA